ncbi:hypothetical protein QAD02_012122 [Eretmocerus hayati]|uniref:Uncharacterized protein n=1 Tax=Eretmocerus hayati TaxID=131215 RepID=A0ACC2P3K1_9HYME|nr:hypothetical protein QAD02_012122 [Eretmocerus hayati]
MGRNFGEKKKKRGKSFHKTSKPKVLDQMDEQTDQDIPTVQQEAAPYRKAITMHVPPNQDDEESQSAAISGIDEEDCNGVATPEIQQFDSEQQITPSQRRPREDIAALLDAYQPLYESSRNSEIDEFALRFRRDFVAMLSQDKEIAIMSLAQTARDVLTDPAKADIRGSMAYLIHSLFKP